MQDHNEFKSYTFLDYHVFPHKREVLKNNETSHLKLSKKSFDLLMLLIQSHGHVVTKKQMFEVIWPNQIVTEAALSKQITRLRNELLGDDSSKPVVIETVRGVGIKLTPTVNEVNLEKPKKESQRYLLLMILIAILFIFAMALYFINFNNEEQNSTELHVSQSIKPINMALVSTKETDDWLNAGGINYLYERLQSHVEINTFPPNLKWFENQKHQTVAIQLSEFQGVDYVLEINSQFIDKEYVTNVVLRRHNGVIAKHSLRSESLSGLFDKIDLWVFKELELNTQIQSAKLSNYQTTDYVLETYLRGKQVAIHENYEKAAQFLQTATNQDKDFLPAWITLAEVESKLGNHKKALALTKVIASHSAFNVNNKDDMMVLNAKYLVGLNQLDEADSILNQAISMAEQSNDKSTLIDAITIKIQTHFNTGTIGQGTIDLLKKQILLLKEIKPDPYLMAVSSYNLAVTYHQFGKIELATQAINESIGLYSITDNKRGVVVSHSLLARLYKDKGESGKALLELEKVENLFEQIDGIDEQQVYLQYKAENQIYYGLRKEAQETIGKLQKLNQKSDSLELKIVALSLSFELNQIHKDYQQSKTNVKQLKSILENQPSGYPPIYKDLILTYDMFITALTEMPEKSRLKMKENLKSNPNIKSYFDKEVRMIEAIILTNENKNILALEIYQDLLKEYVEANTIQSALYYAGYPMLDLLWKNNKPEYIKTMNYLDEISTFKYPIDKYKAQYLAFKKDYINAYLTMVDLKSKSNQFWTIEDQLLLEQYQAHTTQ